MLEEKVEKGNGLRLCWWMHVLSAGCMLLMSRKEAEDVARVKLKKCVDCSRIRFPVKDLMGLIDL